MSEDGVSDGEALAESMVRMNDAGLMAAGHYVPLTTP